MTRRFEVGPILVALGAIQHACEARTGTQNGWRIVAVDPDETVHAVSRYRLRGIERTTCSEGICEVVSHGCRQRIIGAQVPCE